MKFTKFFRILTLATIVSLLLLAIPASPALAAKAIELDPEEGEIGSSFKVEGSGFPHSATPPATSPLYAVDIYFSSQEASKGDTIGTSSGDDVRIYEELSLGVAVDDEGEFTKSRKVPSQLTDGKTKEDVHGGTYYVYVTMADEDEIEAVAEFTVIAGQITLSPTNGVVGTEVKITGLYFADREDITVEYDGREIDIKSGDTRTTSAGGFACYITIPPSPAGARTVAVEDESDHVAEATFTVKPEIAISADDGKKGDTVAVTGSGFGDEVGVDVMLDSSVVASGETNDLGSFTISFEVPDVAEGDYEVTVEDEDGNEDSVAFTIYIATEVSISPVTTQASPGNVGMDITISGVGFIANHEINITYATEPTVVKTVTSDADGAFTATFKAPKSEAGAHTITASDGTNSLTTTFIMESTPPPVPEPILPETDVKAATPVHFAWEEVTDKSLPVTYTLQVAIDDDFTVPSIVRECKGLTDPEYTLTEAEKLEPRKKETPYYWRVKAIDAASNESAWSTPKSFYTGGFTLPSWQVHLWWGIGVTGAIFFGIWLSKRRVAY